VRLDHVRKAIAFGAHPDDVEVGAGGLMAKLAAMGASVTLHVASIPNRHAVRTAEAQRAAAHLGVTLVLPPDDRETRVEELAMHELVARYDRALADKPDLVIVHGAHDAHQDHLMVHRAVQAALRGSRCDLLAFATRLPVGGMQPAPTCVVDITTTIEHKLAAIAEHVSQFHPGFAEKRRDFARALGHTHGVEYAEVFEVLRISL
jgi:LmbE family N-acetylglucosaminyl deacetylase